MSAILDFQSIAAIEEGLKTNCPKLINTVLFLPVMSPNETQFMGRPIDSAH